ncbi:MULTISPECIES: PAS domain-containing protein [unclassified Aureimonas]|uniref:PAS domain-containing protein n=1 Tax=unclassified Aureimonas TaxID=2615206 RepID=UPI0006F98962|nr:MULTISPECIES: PAS domain-containing protein [unclassified Aureimonas]KQT57388.1 hypothetical protein ASG62_08650 [Aureimonas sp. Leaf427]KQT77066.1 hypothetical protein ASG54_12515 [Aureimonas sp. Leaf460]
MHEPTKTPALPFLTDGGEAGALMRGIDWSGTPLGAPALWPAELRTIVGLMLGSRQPMLTVWGPERTTLYNDGYAAMCGQRHPQALGRPFQDLWYDIWPLVEPILERAYAGESTHMDDIEFIMHRNGYPEEAHFAFSYTPVTMADGSIGGMFCACTETTEQVAARRAAMEASQRQRLLLQHMPGFVGVLSGPDHVFEYVNDAYVAISGARAFLGHTVREVFPELEGQGFYELLDEVFETGRPFMIRATPIRLSGEEDERYIDLLYQPIRDGSGAVTGIFVGGYDVTEAQTSTRSLAESEERLRALVSTSSEVLYSHNPDWSEMSALSGGNFLADTTTADPEWFSKYIPAEEQARVRAAIDRAVATKSAFELEHKVVRADGDIGWTLSRSVPLLDAAGEIREWFGAASDVTERRATEEALRESEEQFRVLAQALPNQIWASRPDGHLDWFNEQTYAYVGLRPGELDGKAGWSGVVHPDDLSTAAEAWEASLSSGEIYEVEFRIRRADGLYRWFLARAEPVRDADGRIARWVGTNTDIDGRRRQALALEAGNAALAAEVAERTSDRDSLWQLSMDIMLRCDFQGRIVAVNPAWTEVLGWRADELVGSSLFDILHPDDIENTRTGAARSAEGAELRRFENRYRHKDGTYRWIDWSTRSAEGLINAVGRDVTADREKEEQLAATAEALRQSQKMEAVGQLTGGLAHDFNNLLAGISGSLELMQARISQGRIADLDRYMIGAQGAAKRAAALTHRLLAFSRRQTLDPKATDVNRLVAGMEDLIRRTVGPEIAVETVATAGLWSTLVDPPQLENALLNLCINARDAMPDGGKLTIETANRWLDDRAARERDVPPGQYISMCVSDNGTGMPADVIERAFDPFFTTKPIGVGTGLGLSMIYGFARQSGGQVQIYSEVGQGTMVCVYLPRHHEEEEAATAAPGTSAIEPIGSGETVLVIDDEPLVRMLVVDVLEDLGYTALEAGDGPQGLKVLRSDVRLDLLITDVGLPNGMNGRQVADAARELRPDLKILFVTGYTENAVLSHGHLSPGMQVVTKPFDMTALADRIRAMIGE